jgi:hypothetical protein
MNRLTRLKTIPAVLLGAALGMTAAPAFAGTITPPTYDFTIHGSYTDAGPDPMYSGTLTVFDDSVTSVDIAIGFFGPFNNIESQMADGSNWELVLDNATSPVNTLYLIIHTTATLFAGETSTVGSGSYVASDTGMHLTDEIRGTLTAATPLPGALPLFAGGLGLVGFLARRRNRKVSTLTSA